MSQKYTKQDKAAGAVYFCVMLLLILIAAMVSVAFYIYPICVAVALFLSRGAGKEPPAIADATTFDDAKSHRQVAGLVVKYEGALAEFEEVKEGALASELDLTKVSDHTRFDPRTRAGKEANRHLDRCDAAAADALEKIKASRVNVSERIPAWRSQYDRWAKKTAMRGALWNALFTAFVVTSVFRFTNMVPSDIGDKLAWLLKKASVALLWKPEGVTGLEPFFLASLASYAVFAVSLMIRRHNLLNAVDPDKRFQWEYLIMKWSDVQEFGFFRGDESEDEKEADFEEVTSEAPQSSKVSWTEVLEVDANASVKQIKAAYHQQIKRNHSDGVAMMSAKIRKLAEVETVKINLAYDEARSQLGFR